MLTTARSAALGVPCGAGSDLGQSCRFCRPERNFPNLRFTTEGGKRVAEVAELLQEMGVPASQPGRACKRLKTRHGFTEADVFERPRRGEKKGGRLQWVGTRAALVKLWVDC